MKTIGQLLKDARIAQKLSIEDISERTKIKQSFIAAIEKQDWPSLPDFGVLSGFIKNIASALQIEPAKATALLRRDYPPKLVGEPNPKPDLQDRSKISWSPKLTFIAIVVLVLVSIGGYLGYQYKQAYSAPGLALYQPKEGQTISEKKIIVEGKTDPDTSIIINNQPATVGKEGKFETELLLLEGSQQIKVTATSRIGKISVITRNITVETQN